MCIPAHDNMLEVLSHINLYLSTRLPQNNGFQGYAGRRTKLALAKSLQFSELNLGILFSEFRFPVFFPLDCGVDS